MPEAAVYEDGKMILWQYNIWSPGKAVHIEPETEPPCMKKAPDGELWLSVAATDSGHHPRPSLSVYNVHIGMVLDATSARQEKAVDGVS